MKVLQIATWDMSRWSKLKNSKAKNAWKCVKKQGYDIFFFQRSQLPNNLIDSSQIVSNLQDTRCPQTGIYCPKFQIEPCRDKVNYRGIENTDVSIAKVSLSAKKSIICISICRKTEEISSQSNWATPNLHRLLSDLTPLFTSSRQNIILAGNFGASTQEDNLKKKQSNTGVMKNMHSIFFKRLEDFGMKSVYEINNQMNNHYERTYYNSKATKQYNYIFLSRSLANKFKGYSVERNEFEFITKCSDYSIVKACIAL